uniref:Uncharacterized protein n=1 Tax=Anopheles atroparvus TaxID=41427 RepID=A0A182J1L7_ANOAO
MYIPITAIHRSPTDNREPQTDGTGGNKNVPRAQKRSRTMYTGIKYNKLGKKPPSGSRTTRISIPAEGDDLLEPIVNNGDEDDDDDDDDDDEDDYDGGASGRLATGSAADAVSDQEEASGGQLDSRRSTAAPAAARGKRTFRYVSSSTRT